MRPETIDDFRSMTTLGACMIQLFTVLFSKPGHFFIKPLKLLCVHTMTKLRIWDNTNLKQTPFDWLIIGFFFLQALEGSKDFDPASGVLDQGGEEEDQPCYENILRLRGNPVLKRLKCVLNNIGYIFHTTYDLHKLCSKSYLYLHSFLTGIITKYIYINILII